AARPDEVAVRRGGDAEARRDWEAGSGQLAEVCALAADVGQPRLVDLCERQRVGSHEPTPVTIRTNHRQPWKRAAEYGAGSMWAATPARSSATSFPVAGAIDAPSMLWPAAMRTLAADGLRSMTGRPSGVIGRQPNHSSSTTSPYGSCK